MRTSNELTNDYQAVASDLIKSGHLFFQNALNALETARNNLDESIEVRKRKKRIALSKLSRSHNEMLKEIDKIQLNLSQTGQDDGKLNKRLETLKKGTVDVITRAKSLWTRVLEADGQASSVWGNDILYVLSGLLLCLDKTLERMYKKYLYELSFMGSNAIKVSRSRLKDLKRNKYQWADSLKFNSVKVEPIYHVNTSGKISEYPVAFEVFARPPLMKIMPDQADTNIDAGPLFYELHKIKRGTAVGATEAIEKDIAALDYICISQIIDNFDNIINSKTIQHVKSQTSGFSPGYTINISSDYLKQRSKLKAYSQLVKNIPHFFEVELSERIANDIDLTEHLKEFIREGKHNLSLDDCSPGTSWFTLSCAFNAPDKEVCTENNISSIKIDFGFYQKTLGLIDIEIGRGIGYLWDFIDLLLSHTVIMQTNPRIIIEGINKDNIELSAHNIVSFAKKNPRGVWFQYWPPEKIALNDKLTLPKPIWGYGEYKPNKKTKSW